ncbi:MAG: amidohydrolase family protein [Ignavibacteriales bacterium]|nr:amidohydrolase family protein [Ignavibacteriales bacterium]
MNVISHWSLVISFFTLLFALNSPLYSSDQIPGKKQERPIALFGGTIHTVSGETIENGILTFKDGKIEIVSKSMMLPPGYERIDCKGKHIYPGLFSSWTTLGLFEIGAVRATRDASETGRINPNVRAERAVNPESELIPVTRANGVTYALTAPQGGVISGNAAIIQLDGWTYEDMTLKAQAGMIVNWPSMRISTSFFERRSEEDQKKDRDNSLKEIRNAFNDAKAYWMAKNANKIVKHDSRWEAMIPVLEKKEPVMVTANEMSQIEAAVSWAEDADVKLIIVGGNDAWRVVDLLKKKNIPVITDGTHRTPSRSYEAYDTPFLLPKKLYDAGIQFCISADEGGDGNYRNLPYQVATAVAYGLPYNEGLKAMTLYPAQIFGVDNRIGSLEVGKDATLIVTNGDILDIRSNVEMEFIEGKKVDLTSRHTMLWEKYKTKYGKK